MPGYEGRWLAGFAPVGDTGFVVIGDRPDSLRRGRGAVLGAVPTLAADLELAFATGMLTRSPPPPPLGAGPGSSGDAGR